ncbi:MAG TPA: TolC family outer membrane protein [Steroidobacteraceae bacterium]|nr:TolC family outer membrane protein [Steroidobacteraceae bacterium]
MKRLVAAFSALALASVATGKDLIGVYQDALRFDTQIREADATRKAAREANPQAWAALLPQVSGNYAWTRSKFNGAQLQPFPAPNGGAPIGLPINITEYSTQHGYQLQLQQSVFSWANLETIAKAHKQVAQAEAAYHAAQEDLVQRVAIAYFNILNAKDNLDAQQASLEALTRQLDQANKRFQVGLIAITDVKEAQAAHDSAAAAVIDAKRNLANMQQALREITDQDYPNLSKPGEDMPLQPPKPADPERWVSVSMDQNLNLVAAKLSADVARDNVRIAFGGHLPTLSITGTRSDQRTSVDETFAFPGGSPTRINGPTFNTNNQIGLQINVPIFSGGLVQSEVRQAQYQWIAAKDHVQTVSRQTEHQARDAYDGVVSEASRVSALKANVESAQTALQATEAGYQVGTRTAVDVLTQRQALVQAQTNYAQARYTYITDIIALRLAAGTLDESALDEIDHWLTVNEPISTAPVTQPAPGVPPQP